MCNIIWELELVHEILKKSSPAALLGGVLLLVAGLLLGRVEMIFAGAFVTVVGAIEFVILLLGRYRSSS
jgi:hypothetical protein